MKGKMHFLTLLLSLVYTQPACAREVVVILGGGKDDVEVYTGKASH
jgi:hypothetical protein